MKVAFVSLEKIEPAKFMGHTYELTGTAFATQQDAMDHQQHEVDSRKKMGIAVVNLDNVK